MNRYYEYFQSHDLVITNALLLIACVFNLKLFTCLACAFSIRSIIITLTTEDLRPLRLIYKLLLAIYGIIIALTIYHFLSDMLLSYNIVRFIR